MSEPRSPAVQTLFTAGAGPLLEALAAGTLSSQDLVQAHLDRIARLNPALNAVVSLDGDAALGAARAVDEARARGQPLGPLAGLPMTVKDSLEVMGFPAVCGSPALRDYQPREDAAAVARLRAAGAIFLGKTNVPLYAADFQTFNEVFGTTANPHALDRTPGGSSGGAAAALAAGFTPLELGSDLAGSLRIPAHACGVVSLKPSYGVVPLEGSLSGPPGRQRRGDLWVVGPMARTVADLKRLLDILAGPTRPEEPAWQLDLPAARPGQLPRLALWNGDPLCPPDGDVAAAIAAAAQALEATGQAEIVEARPGFSPEEYFVTHCQLMYAEMAGGLPDEVFDYFARRASRLRGRPVRAPGPGEVTDFMAAGLSLGHRDWLQLAETRERYRRAWAGFFGDFDGLLCPAAPTVATHLDQRRLDQRTQVIGGREAPALLQCFWSSLATAAYLPAVTVPVGRSASGLPIGAQLIGPYLGERQLLRVAALLEAVMGGFQPPAVTGGCFRPSAGP